MPVFDYRALDKKGKKLKGMIEAESEARARSVLRGRNIYLVSIREGHLRGGGRDGQKVRSLRLFERVRSEELNVMTRQLATLLGANVPLVQALSSIVDQTTNHLLKKIVAQIKDSVNEGNSLTNALAEHPRLFSSVYVNMVRAGEASGSLDIVLDRLAEFGEKQDALKARLRAALVYPIFMGVIGTFILFFLITYVVPNITQVFADMDKVLPLPTLLLLAASDWLKQFWWLLLLFFAGTGIGWRYFIQQKSGQRVWDLLKLKLPIFGTVMQRVILARFASTLASLLESGVGLMTAMQIVATLVNNVHIAKVVNEAMEDINQGRSMTNALAGSAWFPPLFVQMIGVGEQSGTVEKMLQKVAVAYEREVESAILAMTSLIEPLMIVMMGCGVGFVVLSILLPIFEMNQLVG